MMAATLMSVADVVDEVRKDKVFYDVSGGGVTLSGGEPAIYPDFAAAILKQCHKEGIDTAVETCGHVARENLEILLPYSKTFFYDIKHMDSKKHHKWTGVETDLILENLAFLANNEARIVVRTPIVPGFNNDEKAISDIAKYLASLCSIHRYELLPYHNYGSNKYRCLGRKYELEGGNAPPTEEVAELARIACQYGIDVQVGA